MNFYPSRKFRSRRERLERKKIYLYILVNLFLIYLILLSISTISSNTYSYFSDNTKYTGLIQNMDNFCEDKDYKQSHQDLCNDNSGIGNGSDPVDNDNFDRGDGDNPGHQDEYCPQGNCNDHNNGNGSEKKESIEKKDLETLPQQNETNTNYAPLESQPANDVVQSSNHWNIKANKK